MSVQPEPSTQLPHDPEHDPRGSYALEPSYVQRLTDRIITSTGEAVTTYAPGSGQALASMPQSSVEDVADAFRRAQAAQEGWARRSLDERARILHNLHDIVLRRQEEILDLITLESGKSRRDAYLELVHVALTARYYARTAHRHLDTQKRNGIIPVLTQAEVNYVPKGVVGIIAPWNYPLTMAISDGLPALLAGNAVVTKPDAQTMLTALLGAEMLEEAGFPRDLWNVVAGPGRLLGTPIIAESNYICFTGSTATGKIVARQCADRLIGASLELGGKNPIIVLKDADLENAAEGAVRACFSNAGQLCVSTERVLVAEEIYDRFKEKFVAKVNALRLSTDTGWGVDMGSLISQDQLDTVIAHVDDAVGKGAVALTGGKARPDLGPYYYEPTVLEGVTDEMTCRMDETFGPVVSLYRFSGEEEAVAKANEGIYGLNAAIYSKDVKRARIIARQVKCGTININEAFGSTFGSIDLPMGGMRESGMGRRQGSEGIHRYTEVQSVATQHIVRMGPQFGLSDKRWAQVLTVGLKALDKMGRA